MGMVDSTFGKGLEGTSPYSYTLLLTLWFVLSYIVLPPYRMHVVCKRIPASRYNTLPRFSIPQNSHWKFSIRFTDDEDNSFLRLFYTFDFPQCQRYRCIRGIQPSTTLSTYKVEPAKVSRRSSAHARWTRSNLTDQPREITTDGEHWPRRPWDSIK